MFMNMTNIDGNNSIKVDERLKHIAFIMDGNGRWAQKRMMPREYGHKVGAEVFKKITRYCGDIGIEVVTVYAFSTENWKRPQTEVNAIIRLFFDYLNDALNGVYENDVRVVFIGKRNDLDPELRTLMEKVEEESKNNSKLLNIALNYGGRCEVVDAVNRLIASGRTNVTEDDISANLYNADCPPPDLVVRTGGEKRTSNFLMWESVYSEWYFSDTLWPDYSEKDVDEAVTEFYRRNRRYGGV